MCDYSLECVTSRPAKVGDRLVSSRFANTPTRGFTAVGEPNVAVCLQAGTELAFDQSAMCDSRFGISLFSSIGSSEARFRHVDLDRPYKHHDALEFSNGKIVLLTQLREGQRATVLQLPADQAAESKQSRSSVDDVADDLPAARVTM